MEFLTLRTGGVQNSWHLWREGYRIPDTSTGRGTEFLRIGGGVQNSCASGEGYRILARAAKIQNFLALRAIKFSYIFNWTSNQNSVSEFIMFFVFGENIFKNHTVYKSEFPTHQLGGVQNTCTSSQNSKFSKSIMFLKCYIFVFGENIYKNHT